MEEWELFEKSKLSIKDKLANFPVFVRRQDIGRFCARYELFRQIVAVKGSIIECGVHLGGGLMTWAKLSANLEPIAIHREIIGFDTFAGFPKLTEKDKTTVPTDFKPQSDVFAELTEAIEAYDRNRFLAQFPKVHLVKGDAVVTIPQFVQQNPHLVVALLFLDFDLYEPTKIALQHLAPRVPKGGIIAFDELNNSCWPGETIAALEYYGNFNSLSLRKFSWDPNIAYVVVGE